VARGRRPGKPGAESREAAPGFPLSDRPWKVRYSPRILAEDLHTIGHAAYETAKRAIQKKLAVDPHQYGSGLRPPLDGIYKLKSSHVRVAYHIEEPAHEVWVLMIGDRRDIWDHHEDDILGRLVVMRAEREQGASTRENPRTRGRQS